jgi:hypothetical protein
MSKNQLPVKKKKNYARDELDLHMTRISGNYGIQLFEQHVAELHDSLVKHLHFLNKTMEKTELSKRESYLEYLSDLGAEVNEMNVYNTGIFHKIQTTLGMQKKFKEDHAQLMKMRAKLDQLPGLFSSVREKIKEQTHGKLLDPHDKLLKGLEKMEENFRRKIENLESEEKRNLYLPPEHVEQIKFRTKQLERNKLRNLKLETKCIDFKHTIDCDAHKESFDNQVDALEIQILNKNDYIRNLRARINKANEEIRCIQQHF